MKTNTLSSLRRSIIGILLLGSQLLSLAATTGSDPLDNWQLRRPLRIGTAVTYGNGRYVSVGNSGLITSSTDAIMWNQVASPTSDYLASITYGNGIFVAVGVSGNILRSNDGISWNIVNSGTTQNLLKVLYGNGSFIAAGEGVILISADGIAWTAANVEVFSGTILGVAYGNGVYVAGGGNYGNSGPLLYQSVDGWNWQRVTTSADTAPIMTVTFGLGVFTCGRMYSTDGLFWHWSDLETPARDLVFANGVFVASDGVDGLMLRSTDGLHWSSSVGFQNPVTSLGVTFASGVFVATGDYSGDGRVIRSTDGLNWVPADPDAFHRETLWATAYGAGQFVAVGENGAILHSAGGRRWDYVSPGATGRLRSVAYGNGKFIAVAGPGDGITSFLTVFSSGDGITWTNSQTALAYFPQSLTFLNGQFLMPAFRFEDSTTLILRSSNGNDWSILAELGTLQLRSIAFGNGIYVGVSGSAAYSSPDLVHWTFRSWAPVEPNGVAFPSFSRVTYGNGRFVAVCDTLTPSVSLDGIHWQDSGMVAYGAEGGFASVAVLGTEFYATGQSSGVWHSEDGINWIRSPSAGNFNFCLASGGNSVVGVGGQGIIVQLTPGTPTIAALSPDSAVPNGSAFTLTVCGSGFAEGATVFWNGSTRPTTFISDSQIACAIPASDIAAGSELSTVVINVQNPSGAGSNPSTFVIKTANVLATQSTAAAPGETVTVTTAPTADGSSGISATLKNGIGTSSATVTLASYESNPAPDLGFELAGNFMDLQVTGSDPSDSIIAQFYYPTTGSESAVSLKFYNPQTASWEDVLSSQGLPPVLDTRDNLDVTVSGGRFTVVFDNSSTPTITALSGTYFAQAVQSPITFTGFLPPVGGADATGGTQSNPLRTFKMGSTIPVKFTGTTAAVPLSSGFHRLSVVKFSGSTTTGTPIDATPQDVATTGNLFRLTNGEWRFNLDTKATGMSIGIWQLIATLSDGSRHTVWVQLK
jgi:hypothetical protein